MSEENCYNCTHKRSVPGDAHIQCINPDPLMTGSRHGIEEGWFIYPILFDPVWMTKKCTNFSRQLTRDPTI